MTDERNPPPGGATAQEDFFDAEFLSELEGLAATPGPAAGAMPLAAALQETLASFLAPPSGSASTAPLTEEDFVALTGPALAERTNTLIELCRRSQTAHAVRAVESFVVFFQALIPTLSEEGAQQIKRLFFHLVPTLLQVAFAGFSGGPAGEEEGAMALRDLETVLIEISSVRLAPTESELVFRAIDQMAAFIGVGEYVLASDMISAQLLGLISRNKLTRALYRLMEVEVQLQRYLNERRGYPTPQVRLPEDFTFLADYGPLRLLKEDTPGGGTRRFIQVQIPHIPVLRDVVLHLASDDGRTFDLRLDAVGSAEIDVPPGTYSLGLVYQPEETRGR
jgi:hypothetical protein